MGQKVGPKVGFTLPLYSKNLLSDLLSDLFPEFPDPTF